MALKLVNGLLCLLFFLDSIPKTLAPRPFFSQDVRQKRSENIPLLSDEEEPRSFGDLFSGLGKFNVSFRLKIGDVDDETGSEYFYSSEGSGDIDLGEFLMEGSGSDTNTSSESVDLFDALRGILEFAEILGDFGSVLEGDTVTEAISNNSTWKLNEPCENSDQCAVNVEHSICGEELKCVCTEGFHISEIPTVGLTCVIDEMPPQPPVIDPKTPCTSPFEEIAYKMCILPEMEQRLSWRDAVTYCRSKGLELAYDSVVIKARRYFNNNLGESGSRERWPIWVGGKREVSEDGQNHWKWVDGTSVPDFLWTDSRPRSFKGQDNPEGVCMILDGFQAYYPDSLPCHNRRRFVCQRLA